MPTLVVLATQDLGLADVWERQLPRGRAALRLGAQSFPTGPVIGFAAVVVLDVAADPQLPASLARCPTILVGEVNSLPFEQAKLAGRGKVYLSYQDSTTRLAEFFPLLEEVAEKQSLVEMLADKHRRVENSRPNQRTSAHESAELWDFLEGAIENIDTRDRLIAEFRRASRQLLHASHAVFFLREADGFRADRGTSFFSTDDPLVGYFENHPTVIDGTNWEGPIDPVAELAVRNRLALWGARLLIPVHDNGRLLGLIALGVRDDGQPYDESNRTRSIFFARLLRHFLLKSAHFSRLNHIAEQTSLGAKYLPGTLVLSPDESIPKHVPLIVRELIGQARRSREVCRSQPSRAQPFRASAGLVAETGGTWAVWEEASSEVYDLIDRERNGRRELLRELALTLSHELGNALVSLATFRQVGPERPLPPPLVDTIKGDVYQLEMLNDNLALMQSLHEGEAAAMDLREVVQSVCNTLNVRAEVGNEPIILSVAGKLIEFALKAFIRTLGENRPEPGMEDLSVKLRTTGSRPNLTALLAIKGKYLELEGILPEPVNGAVPNQGRLGVFLAKEILRLHNGEIHAGPGMEGTEILITIREW